MKKEFNWELPADPDPKSDQEGIRVYRATKELKKEEEDLKLEKAIEPIREAYSRLSPSGRSTFIAQMVYLLTK